MNSTSPSPVASQPPGNADRHSLLFRQLVLSHSQMAAMFLGAMPHPETGERLHDLDAARHFIDQLDMLEAKTRGNLGGDEAALLHQTLSDLRMLFVQSVESPAPAPAPEPPSDASTAASATATGTEPESPKRFSKKY